MKKIKKFIVSFLSVTLLLSVSAFAAPADKTEVKEKLIAAGVPSQYAEEVVRYFSENGVTETKANEIIAGVTEIKEKVGDKTLGSDFTPKERADLLSDANSLVKDLGLTISVSGQEISVLNAEKSEIGKIKKDDAVKIVSKVDVKSLEEIITPVVFPVGTGSTVATTEMKKTATNNENVLVAGVAIMALAAVVYSVSRKKVLA